MFTIAMPIISAATAKAAAVTAAKVVAVSAAAQYGAELYRASGSVETDELRVIQIRELVSHATTEPVEFDSVYVSGFDRTLDVAKIAAQNMHYTNVGLLMGPHLVGNAHRSQALQRRYERQGRKARVLANEASRPGTTPEQASRKYDKAAKAQRKAQEALRQHHASVAKGDSLFARFSRRAKSKSEREIEALLNDLQISLDGGTPARFKKSPVSAA